MLTRTMQDILNTLRAAQPDLAQVYSVSGLALFGSFARGEATATSDIDILVEYSEPPSLFEFVRLQRHLSDLLNVPVDLVMRSALKPAIGARIAAEVVPV